MQNSLACPRCSGPYSVKDTSQSKKRALLLTCGHTFCESCLWFLIQERKTEIHCPICFAVTKVPEGAAGLKNLIPDRYIMGLLVQNRKNLLHQELEKLDRLSKASFNQSASRKKPVADKQCKECNKKPATTRCEKCDTNTCTPCFQQMHSLSNSLRHHLQIPLTEDGHLEISQMCKEHPARPLEYYCEDDDTIICSRCVIVGSHKSHNITSIEDKNRQIVSDMEPNLQVANHVLRRLRHIDKELMQQVPKTKVDVGPALMAMQAHFLHLHGVLQVREHILEQQILDNLHSSMAPFEKMKEQLQNNFRQLDVTVKVAHRIMNNNDEVIVNAKEILEKLSQARDIPCILQLSQENIQDSKVSFVPGDSRLEMALLDYGHVKAPIIEDRFKLLTLREMPEKLSEEMPSVESVTPDSVSVTSTTTSEDVIIEEEQDILLDDSSSQASDVASKTVTGARKKAKPEEKLRTLPAKGKIKGSNENVYVTHIQTPSKFFVQLKKDASKLTTLSYSMQQWCSQEHKKNSVIDVAVDDLVLAKYTLDNQWYRARIKKVVPPSGEEETKDDKGHFDKTQVEVVYIDYGNREVIPVTRLLNMKVTFMKYAEFALECSLFNIVPINKDGSWTIDAVQALAKMVENKAMLLKVVREENNVLQVDLCKPPEDSIADDRPMSVRDALVFMEYASLESPYSIPDPRASAHVKSRQFLSPDMKEEGELCQVLVTYAGTPNAFYVQELGENFEYLTAMMTKIQDTYTKKRSEALQIFCPQIGMICIAQFSGDGQWYRGKVVGLPGHRQVTVMFVDYGIQETVGLDQICKVLDEFCVLPSQGLKCSLVDVESVNANDGWSDRSVRWWSEKVTQEVFEMKVIALDQGITSVILRELSDMPTQPLNSLIVEKGLARSVGKWSEVVIEVKNTISEYVPRLSYTASEAAFPAPCDLALNPVYWKSRNCQSKRRYQEDIILTPPNSPERPAALVDTELTNPKTSRDKQRVALSPDKATPREKVSPGRQHKKSQKKQTVAKKMSQDANSQGASASPSPTPPERTKSPTVVKPEKPVHPSVEVLVSHFVSPDDFHAQLAAAGRDGLNQLMTDLDTTYRDSEVAPVSWKTDSYCVALSKDGHWYRSKITNTLLNKLYEVYMLDFGFSETVGRKSLRSILRQFRSYRCFAFHCHLANLIPAGGMKKWSKTACEYMEDKIRNKKLYISKKGSADKNHSLPVDLLIEDYIEDTALEPGRKIVTSLIDMMKESGLAIPMPKKHHEPVEERKTFPVLYYKKAEAEVKTGDCVMPVYVDYDAVIHCYTMEGDDIFQAMCDNLHRKFKDSDPEESDQAWVKGQACAAFYEKDGQWHRATVVQIEPTMAQVHFIDYGNTEWVTFDKMRADIEEFVNIPQQTFLCKLHNVKPIEGEEWKVTTLEFMHKQLVNKYCTITVVERHGYMNEHMTVNLALSGKDFGSTLVQYGLAQHGDYITDQVLQSSQIAKVFEDENPFITMAPKPEGETIPIQVTHVELPNIVYVQLLEVDTNQCESEMDRKYYTQTNKYLQQLSSLSQDLNNLAPTLPIIPTPKVGLPCVAQFGLDNCWYRALVIQLYPETRQMLVLFVDYGNSEVITVHKMRALPKKYLSLPCQASRYQLAHIGCPDTALSWTKEALYTMMTTLGNKALVARVTSHYPACIEVYLQEDIATETLIYQPLIDSGLVTLQVTEEVQDSGEDQPSEKGDTRSTKPKGTVKPLRNKKQVNNDDEEDTEQNEENDESISTVTGEAGSGDGVTSQSENKKSWAEMAEEGSLADVEEMPSFEDLEEGVEEAGKHMTSKGKVRKNREKREKVEVVAAEAEEFD